MLNQSMTAVRPNCHVTAAISPRADTLTPSNSAPAHHDFRIDGRMRLARATKKNAGRKMANVASKADCQPPIS